ncbi:glycosyltransferase [Clostridium sp. C2-6-12]|uniref:glycosyltransferase family 2 protein n=1 Tax=Clostridium sp. C2-6-12 TaxID=2698832 RepID=UPI0013716A81|nr:glycosyltransferase [Clostridium sp. C2-6-12]
MRVNYVKYNRERLPHFQIETAICEQDGKLVVTKRALTGSAEVYIKSIFSNYLLLKDTYKNTNIAKATLNSNKIIFEYKEGKTYDLLLVDAILENNKEKFFRYIDDYVSFINNLEGKCIKDFYADRFFRDIFGISFEAKNISCLSIANIDMIFDNLIIDSNNKFNVIDYEWVFQFEIPTSFVIFRSLYVFYARYRCQTEKIGISFDEILEYVGITQEEKNIFIKMDESFQEYVHGKEKKYVVSDKYLKEVKQIQELEQDVKSMSESIKEKDSLIERYGYKVKELSEWGNSLDKIIKDKESKIKELSEWGNSLDESIKDKECKINDLQEWGNSLDKIIKEKDNKLNELSEWANSLNYSLNEKEEQIQKYENSNGYRMLLKYYKVRDKLLKIRRSSPLVPSNINSLQENENVQKDEKNSLVSIIIPVYNNAQYLEKCITSALEQNYENIEVVVVDDCSTDPKVYNILDSFTNNSRFKYFKNDVNSGISTTMNNAIIKANGQWIAFLDCDDWLESNAIERLMDCIYSKPGAVYGYTDRVNEYQVDQRSEVECFKCRPTENYFKELLVGMYTSHLKIINKSVFVKIGLHESRFDGAQDYDIALKTAFHLGDNAFVYLSEPVYHHRIHNKQTTIESSQKIEKIVNKIKEESLKRLTIRNGDLDKLVSFVILSFEKKDMTLKCIEAIQDTVRIPYEIIVFDNASSKETIDFIKEYIEPIANVKVFYSKENLGCPGGRRQAIKMAKGDYVINLDNDIIVTSEWIEELIVRADSDENIAAVCCKTVFPNETVQFNGGRYHISDGFISFSLIDSEKNESDIETALWHKCDWVPGGATLFKGSVIEHLDYSTGYINAFEDNDISLQIARMGYKMSNCPSAKIYHHHIMFNSKQADSEQNYMRARYNNEGFVKSLLNFYKRNNLIINDSYVHRLMNIEGLANDEIREKVKELSEEN